MIKLELFLKSTRLKASSVTEPRDLVLQYISDQARILTSSAFRRLQAKAQVFSLEENAGVRTRMTHSLEVSSFGLIMARKIADSLFKTQNLNEDEKDALPLLVQSACLIHDIGNPPFGHFGEYAISYWFTEHHDLFALKGQEIGIETGTFEDHYTDFTSFDGNAQGFRILTRLQWHQNEFGLNLCCALLLTFLKYLDCKVKKAQHCKKIGFFKSEEDLVSAVKKELGFYDTKRHPLTYVMEAADDIAYCLSDVEDAIEKDIISSENALVELKNTVRNGIDGKSNAAAIKKFEEIEASAIEYGKNAKVSSKFNFVEFKIRFTRYLVNVASDAFITNIDKIQNGSADSLFSLNNEASYLVECTKLFAKKKIFVSKSAVDVELHGSSVIVGLLNGFLPLLKLDKDQFARLDPDHNQQQKYGQKELEKRLYTLLPKRHLQAYRYSVDQKPELEIFHRLHLIVDLISGMTDPHAVKVFKLIEGISITNR